MSAPRIIVQIAITAAQILGKAFLEAGKQAVKNAKSPPQALGADASGVRNATSGSWTDRLTREHRMTLEEAYLVLNAKREDGAAGVLRNYEHLFKMNSPPSPSASPSQPSASPLPFPPSPPPPQPRPASSSKHPPLPSHSHYLQSKVVRARERIEAEMKVMEEEVGEGGGKVEESGSGGADRVSAGAEGRAGGGGDKNPRS